VAVCAHRPQVGNPTFVYVPRTGNVLRERERHIAALEAEVELKNGWLEKAQQDLTEFDRQHQEVLALFREQKEELERSNRWAESLNQSLDEARARVAALQRELASEQDSARVMAEGYENKRQELEADLACKIEWARDVDKRLKEEIADKERAVDKLHETEKELEDRYDWARRLEEERGRLEGQLMLYRASRWVRLGRKVGLGPELPSG